MGKIIEINGKKYIKIGYKLAEIDHIAKNGEPILKTWSEEKTNSDGTKDCIIHIECLQIASESNK